MFKVLRIAVAAVAATAGLSLAMVDFSAAQSPAVSVAVPSPGGGGGLVGCYRASNQIYGPYWFSFCLNRGRGGTYQVTGGGLNCNGGLDWYDQGRGRVQVDLYRAPCGRGTDWTGDSLSCNASGGPLYQGGGGIGGAIAGAIAGGLGVPAPAVPAPSYGALNCTYYPAAGGYSPVSVYAPRV
jgi:hypothetical protein